LVNNVAEDPRYLAAIGLDAYDAASTRTQAEIAIPLLMDDDVVGVLDVQSSNLGGFTRREQALLDALAVEIASAIHKTRQLVLQREQAWITTAQLQVADAISRSRTQEEMLEAVARLTLLLVGMAQCGVLLWDEEIGAYWGAALAGDSAESTARFYAGEYPIGRWSPLDAVHVGGEPMTTHRAPPWNHRRDRRVARLYPLHVRGRRLGVLIVRQALQPMPESAIEYLTMPAAGRRDELLHSIVTQTSQALESIRLQQAQQEEAWINAALLQVAEAVNSLIDLNEILDTIVRLVPMLIGVESCVILFWDDENETFRGGPSYGLSVMGRGMLSATEFGMTEFPSMVVQDEAFLSPSATLYRVALPRWLQKIFDTDALDAMPLRARGRLVGVLLVGPTANGRPLTGRRMNMLSGISQQAATAVVNNQVYAESAERDRLEQELNVARSIQSSLIPQHSPTVLYSDLASYWQAARQVSGDFYDFFSHDDDQCGIVIADVADKGVPAALFMALSRTIIRSVAFNRIMPASTLERANEIIYNDTASDLFVTVFYGLWNPHTAILTYANGGHNPPFLMRANGTSDFLTIHGMALGVLEHITLRQETCQLEPGDAIVFYTDGVTEAINEGMAEFGALRLQLVVKNARRESADAIVQAINAALLDHTGQTAQFDDITLVILKYRGPE
jgi:serine phosphatase RsbU (regulator of sigma subunit)